MVLWAITLRDIGTNAKQVIETRSRESLGSANWHLGFLRKLTHVRLVSIRYPSSNRQGCSQQFLNTLPALSKSSRLDTSIGSEAASIGRRVPGEVACVFSFLENEQDSWPAVGKVVFRLLRGVVRSVALYLRTDG